MTDRDHFAAAALTGLLSNVQRYQNEPLTRQAYEIADFMLRERGRAVTAHDAAPAARAETSVKEPMVHATGEPGGEPDGTIGTGKQPAPPCVETDGFSPGSSSELINRSAERESPRRECEESQLRDVPQDDNSRAAGGPEHHILEHQHPTLTDDERNAIRTAEGGYFAWKDDNDEGYSPERIAVSETLRKLLERLQ